MKKTITFAIIHFTVAFIVAYLLTGDIIIGSLITMIEPMVNTVAFYFHEQVWSKNKTIKHYNKNPKIKTISFASVHFSVAFLVTSILSGSFVIGGLIAIIEPTINTFAYYFHEKTWNNIKNNSKRNLVFS